MSVDFVTAEDYRQVKASDWPWRNFSPKEMACRGSGKLNLSRAAMDRLQALRDALAKPLIVTSAYRSPGHNAAIGGAAKSRHVAGDAFDISMLNHDPEAFEAAARTAGFTGFGFYGPMKGNFIHIDLGRARFWGERWREPEFSPEPARSRPEGFEDV